MGVGWGVLTAKTLRRKEFARIKSALPRRSVRHSKNHDESNTGDYFAQPLRLASFAVNSHTNSHTPTTNAFSYITRLFFSHGMIHGAGSNGHISQRWILCSR